MKDDKKSYIPGEWEVILLSWGDRAKSKREAAQIKALKKQLGTISDQIQAIEALWSPEAIRQARTIRNKFLEYGAENDDYSVFTAADGLMGNFSDVDPVTGHVLVYNGHVGELKSIPGDQALTHAEYQEHQAKQKAAATDTDSEVA